MIRLKRLSLIKKFVGKKKTISLAYLWIMRVEELLLGFMSYDHS